MQNSGHGLWYLAYIVQLWGLISLINLNYNNVFEQIYLYNLSVVDINLISLICIQKLLATKSIYTHVSWNFRFYGPKAPCIITMSKQYSHEPGNLLSVLFTYYYLSEVTFYPGLHIHMGTPYSGI